MALNRKKSEELQALLAQQAEMERLIKEAEKAQAAKEAVAAKAAKKNGPAYAGLVLDLCEVLGLEPEHPRIRKSAGGGHVEIATDPSNTQLIARLRDVLERIIDAADPALLSELKAADDEGRDRRRDEREKAKRTASATDSLADAESDDDDEATGDDDEEEVRTEPALSGANWN